MKKLIYKICFLLVLLLTVTAGADTGCTVPDNGTGTANFPPSGCAYGNPTDDQRIVNGLPANTTIEIDSVLQNIICGTGGVCSFPGCRMPGGSLGGEEECSSAVLMMPMVGTGSLAGFNRLKQMQISFETHIGPRTPGAPIQSFDTEMFRLQGQLPPGDPDFDLLRITAGNDFGMPSPGHTTLTQVSGGNWNVDSFFDITYRIDFIGAPGGPLAGMSGSTTATIRMTTGQSVTSGGQDCYNVSCGASQYNFGQNPIPASFFDPGSDPFTGAVMIGGGNPDPSNNVIVHRLSGFSLPNIGSQATVPIELVQLSLVSCQPITVTYNGGQNPELWNVSVGSSQSQQGQMTATKTYANGGTFTAQLYVQPVFTFTKVDSPTHVMTVPQVLLTTAEPYPWQDTSPKPNPPCEGNGFYPGTAEPILMWSGNATLILNPPQLNTHPYFALDTKPQWNDALLKGRVAPMPSSEWTDYMGQWSAHLQAGQAYPSNTYFEPNLYAYDPGTADNCQIQVNSAWPDSAGLVMAWHDAIAPSGSYSAAFKYIYPSDPNLANVVITVTVMPPCTNIKTVSFGLKDSTGRIRAWHWNVPGTLPCGVPTTISIDTSVAPPGLGSTTPPANGYMSTPGFDITNVTTLLFDENCQWVASAGVPPPGQLLPRAWNYWHDLIVAPKPVKTIGPLKWSQPIKEISPGVILGWDEKSVRYEVPLLADDWECKDQRPITDIHWWGSFLTWSEPNLPLQVPIAFHFGIWTDVPRNPNDCRSFSHPDELIWEYTCQNFQWNFAGYDKDPRRTTNAASTITAAVFDPTVKDSCFQFNCVLPQASWFYQQPTTFGKGRVYWLSIAAVYQTGITPRYPWGWKTRPKFFNDDAVRITQIVGTWPPTIGAKWDKGEPVEFPQGISWDLAFELTTNAPEPAVPVLDINVDKIVDFRDFAYFANQWLTTLP